MSLWNPVDLREWVKENRDQLKPPVGNKMVWRDERDAIIMIVAGPNARADYHVNVTEEFFYQIHGDMNLKIIHPDSGKPEDIIIREGEIYLLPAHVPHSPQRPAGTVGLVVEQKRPEGAKDTLRWYSEDTNEVVHEADFTLENVETDLKLIMDEFWANEELRTCKSTGSVIQRPKEAEVPPRQ